MLQFANFGFRSILIKFLAQNCGFDLIQFWVNVVISISIIVTSLFWSLLETSCEVPSIFQFWLTIQTVIKTFLLTYLLNKFDEDTCFQAQILSDNESATDWNVWLYSYKSPACFPQVFEPKKLLTSCRLVIVMDIRDVKPKFGFSKFVKTADSGCVLDKFWTYFSSLITMFHVTESTVITH